MLYTNAQINNLLLNGTLDAAAAAREKIKAGHNHLEEDQIATRIAERESKSVSELELERSEPGLNALASRLLGSPAASASTAAGGPNHPCACRREHTTLHACAARARRAVGWEPGHACMHARGPPAAPLCPCPPCLSFAHIFHAPIPVPSTGVPISEPVFS